ncbi:MAG: HAD family hydrolase [Bacteroidetes bacterium]|nr:HAD family hydrolase [Bacteroidota bacterium]MBU1115759.1 HAD family hydrolase [Bacteroidota bacterium]MBU1799453.1 HAD family hydrolase [Bacteroidota bacterium]
MNKFDGIIFDIDGTIVQSNELIFATFNHVTEKFLGKTTSPDEIIALFGPTEAVIIKQLFSDNFENVMNDYYQFYRQNHNKMAKVFDGITTLIDELKSRNILLSIYTGKGKGSTEITLEELGIRDKFDMIVTGDDIEDHKPSPEGVDVFVNKYNLNRDRVLMIGDAPPDVKAAKATGIKIASVLWDSYAKEEVLSMGSDYYFESVKDLSDFLLN